MAERTAKQRAATKRMIAANRARGGGSKSKPKRKKAKKARSRAASLGHARDGYKLQKCAKGATDKCRLSALEHNQGVITRGLTAVAVEVVQHRKALLGGGLISARGKALGKGR